MPLTEEQRVAAQEALQLFGMQEGFTWQKTQIRHSLDYQKYLIEVTHEDTPTKEDFVNPLAEYLGMEPQVISAAIDFEIFDASDETSRQVTVEYLIAHKAEWETE